ncbi:Bug family tripartite tricarboxylate transporter substrate binding protein [Falsiroseomonas selenitidurans]|uniref:Tripartite tricarboxylate transporter substrate binding protein n=1 Tax=Falsiroseomonas selenitidurans TaxID=2716335 RepID=A0ABX1EDB8_9PROT|nr:tripartite tricarboxylate transporter substrate-binding protein [Falsiroseomonas selenitidurans]NKC32890.1 tripartite tricarboxylate transporter substrate binding protein [Falsiroseomonas selenitidurans]
MRLSRRHLLAAPALLLSATAFAQSRPLRVVVPFGAGGLTDVVTRILAEPMSQTLGRPMVVENQGGAGSTIGASTVARAAPDGNTILVGSVGHAAMKALYASFQFDPVASYAPIALCTRQPFVAAVHPAIPVTDLPGFIAWLKSRNGEANFGTAGIGASSHLAAELLRKSTGAGFTVVPYRGTPAAVADLTAGRIDFMIDSQTLLAPLMADNRVRGLAVTSAELSTLLPQLPTIAEAGVPGYDAAAWQAMYAPAGTPAAPIRAISDAAAAALKDPATLKRLADAGVDAYTDNSPEAAARHLASEVAKWGGLVRELGLRG